MSYKEVLVDPKKLEELGSKYFSDKTLNSINDETPTLTKKVDQELLNKFSPVVQDILLSYYYDGLDQKQLATIFNSTQGNISQTLKRARKVIRWYSELPPKPKNIKETVQRIVDKRVSKSAELQDRYGEVVEEYLECLHQSKVSVKYNVSQITIRSIVIRSEKLLRECGEIEIADFIKKCGTFRNPFGIYRKITEPEGKIYFPYKYRNKRYRAGKVRELILDDLDMNL